MTEKNRVFVVGTDYACCEMMRELGCRTVTSPDYADMVVFTGGGDINPTLYNQKPITQTFGINDTRDTAEVSCYHHIPVGIPKIGICRGGQLLNVLNGGSMFQHVDQHNGGNHRLWVRDDETAHYVNSYHHQMMRPDFTNKNMVLLGIAAMSTERKIDGGIDKSKANFETNPDYEIVYYKDTKSFCFQPHPEYKSTANATRDVFVKLLKQLEIL